MIVPPEDKNLGVFGDDNATARVFRIPRVVTNDIDPSSLSFGLDFRYYDGTTNATVLQKVVYDDYVELTWNVVSEDLRVVGTVLLQVNGYDINGTVKYASFLEPFYIGDLIDATGNYTGELSAYQALLVRCIAIEDKYEGLDAVTDDAETATAAANEAANRANQAADNYEAATQENTDVAVLELRSQINSVQSKLNEVYINVKYPPDTLSPCIGDGTAEKAKIKSIIDYVISHKGGTIYFPKTDAFYGVESEIIPIDVPDGVVINIISNGAELRWITDNVTCNMISINLLGHAKVNYDGLVVDGRGIPEREAASNPNNYRLVALNRTGGYMSVKNCVFRNIFGTAIYSSLYYGLDVDNLEFDNVGMVEDEYNRGDCIYSEYTYNITPPTGFEAVSNIRNIKGKGLITGANNKISRCGIVFEFNYQGKICIENVHLSNYSRGIHFEAMTSNVDIDIKNINTDNCIIGIFRQSNVRSYRVDGINFINSSLRTFAPDATKCGPMHEPGYTGENIDVSDEIWCVSNVKTEVKGRHQSMHIRHAKTGELNNFSVIQAGDFRCEVIPLMVLNVNGLKLKSKNNAYANEIMYLQNAAANPEKMVNIEGLHMYVEGSNTGFVATPKLGLYIENIRVQITNPNIINAKMKFNVYSAQINGGEIIGKTLIDAVAGNVDFVNTKFHVDASGTAVSTAYLGVIKFLSNCEKLVSTFTSSTNLAVSERSNLDVSANIAAAPIYVGQIAVSGTNTYIAVGVASSADWKRIDNV